ISKGYRVIRFWDHEVLGNIESVLQRILDELDSPNPLPLPIGEGEEKEMETVCKKGKMPETEQRI
ncbi:MAG TPA: DUF559 domain-containing protein, partial [Nitrospiria bacterium]|nr:DUF559 domain-containing protein [Nitrospiria bacterium]